MHSPKALLFVAIFFGFLFSPVDATAAVTANQQLSANVALNSFAYDYLEKLDGLGYLQDMRTGTKPYTRMQFAKWTGQMLAAAAQRQDVPAYARTMLAALQEEFRPELTVLAGQAAVGEKFGLKQWSLAEVYYHGDTLSQTGTRSTYQPLNVNNNGDRYGAGGNIITSVTLEGKISDRLVLAATPRASYDNMQAGEATLESAYAKTNFRNISIQIGKDAALWGQGTRGSLMFSNNAEPQTAVRLSNIEPNRPGGLLAFLGKENTTISYSVLETHRDVPYPSFIAMRFDFTPSENFTFALARADMIGGKGHMLDHGDYRRWFLGRNARGDDKWNSQAGGDFRWRLPRLGGIQLYGEIYGEDQYELTITPGPYRLAKIYGIYIPRLAADGSWEANFEIHQTDPSWYTHSTYTDGWVFRGNILGDPIGNFAESFYGKIVRYYANASSISLNFERVKMGRDNPAAQKIDSLWINYRRQIEKNLQLDLCAGYANVDNQGFVAGTGGYNYVLGINLTKRY